MRGKLRRLAASACALALILLPIRPGGLTSSGALSNSAAPGGPGMAGTWQTGRKMGVGTAYGRRSRVWFTITEGVLSEVYYPILDTPDTNSLQYVVVDGRGRVTRESADTRHAIRLLDPRALAYEVTNTARDGSYRIVTDVSTDPARAAVLLHSRFVVLRPSAAHARVYALLRPNAAGSSLDNTATVVRSGAGTLLTASRPNSPYGHGPVALALAASPAFTEASVGFRLATSDPLRELSGQHRLVHHYTEARGGTVTEVAAVPLRPGHAVTLALGFGKRTGDAIGVARAALATPYARQLSAYIAGWHAYAAGLHPPHGLTGDLLTQFYTGVLTIKASEDKTYPGALVASPTIPWGNAVAAGDDPTAAGYHLVWSRDLYEQATALLAAGDRATALAALRYLFDRQQSPNGDLPQNTYLDGTTHASAEQMDEVAYPIILAWQLGLSDAATYRAHILPIANHIIFAGPSTGQERWEEAGGYSPSTIAAEIAALVCAADLARRNGDATSATLDLAVADDWTRHVSAWTVTRSGHLSRQPYYMRIDDNTDPNDGDLLSIANGGGSYDERDVADAGFLELVRLGIVRADDPAVRRSLTVVDRVIGARTRNGPGWHRYNHDGYGDTPDGAPWTGNGEGHLWPVFDGERGEYDLALGQKAQAAALLATMRRFAYGAGMIPEQVWEHKDIPAPPGMAFDDESANASLDSIGLYNGEATGSACPLNWSMAQYVRLAEDVAAGRVLEQPSVVARRYLAGLPPSGPALALTAPPADRSHFTSPLKVQGRTAPGSHVLLADLTADGTRTVTALPVSVDGRFSASVRLGVADNELVVVAIDRSGHTSIVERTVTHIF